jgi:hypothetical protein
MSAYLPDMRSFAFVPMVLLACASSSPDADGDDSSGSTGEPSTTALPSTSSPSTTSPSTTNPSTTDPTDATTDVDPDTGDDSSGDDGSTGEPVPEGVPLFIAQGHMGRTTISCDRGQTWIADQSLDDAVRCFDGIDCDHHVGSATGLRFGDGAFIATWGWGTEGNVARTTDGITWETVMTGPTFSGTAYGSDTFVAGSRETQRSTDGGATWSDPIDTGLTQWTPRGIGFANVDGGRFVIGGGGNNEGDVVVSSDAGATWWHPEAVPLECGDGIRSIVSDGAAIVIVRYGGEGTELCVSHDAGTTFEAIDLGDVWFESRAVHDGEQFVVYSGGEAWRSSDGDNWAATPTEPAITPGALAIDEQGNFVAVRGGWQVWYENQEIYRSADGITWEVLAPEAFTGSHPVNHIAFGHVASTTACD